jgi:hypothetical protein
MKTNYLMIKRSISLSKKLVLKTSLFLFFSFNIVAQENSILTRSGEELDDNLLNQLTGLLQKDQSTSYFFNEKLSGSILNGSSTLRIYSDLKGLENVITSIAGLQNSEIIVVKCSPQELEGKQFDFNQFSEFSSLKYILFNFDTECTATNCYSQIINEYMVGYNLDVMIMYQIELPN